VTAAADKLEALRREIDAIDEAIHDLIMRRTEVADQVRELKKGAAVKIRPAREARILYRLMERHRGSFPRRELARIWRELIMATVSVEGPFSAAVLAAGDGPAFEEVARDHYGSFTVMTRHASSHGVIEAVRRREATVGILPFPERDDPDPWWRHLVTEDEAAPRIIARLPFIGRRGGRDAEALVICPLANEPTGLDASFLALDAAEEIGGERLRQALAEVGLDARFHASWTDGAARALWLHLVEVAGFVAPADRRLARLGDGLGGGVKRVLAMGAYALPLPGGEAAR
jgi:chorismate mutase